MADFDAVVIGAGPAGSTAARRLAEGGAKVLLVEKEKLPRHKTCGGGMPVRIGSLLGQVSPEEFVERRCEHMRHTFRFGSPILCDVNGPESSEYSLWMVQRAKFDYTLAKSAAAAGAELIDETRLAGLDVSEGSVSVRLKQTAGELSVTARHIVGADGANGSTARLAGADGKHGHFAAMEVELPFEYGTGAADLAEDTMHLDFGSVPHGYCWIFPKGDHLNIGSGIISPEGRTVLGGEAVKPFLEWKISEYARSVGLSIRPGEHRFFAHPIPAWSANRRRAVGERILFAGDAAGLVCPFFGDGIMHAVESGALAAEAILEGRAASYERDLFAHFGENFEAARKLAGLFFGYERLWYRLGLVGPAGTRAACKLMAGDYRYSEMSGRTIRYLLRSFLPFRRRH